jgi:hypothetical protein
MAHCPSHPSKVSKKPVRVNPLASVSVMNKVAITADELESICRRNDSELMKEWITQLVKTT